MKFTVLLVLISSIVMVSDSTLIIAGIIAVKAAIVAGFVAGGIAGGIIGSAARRNRGFGGRPHRRYGRAVGNVDEMFLSASQVSLEIHPDHLDLVKSTLKTVKSDNIVNLSKNSSIFNQLVIKKIIFKSDADDCAKKLICSLAARNPA
jgi:hypothetical protein